MKERHAALRVLKEHLRVAQEKMKKIANQKRWDVKFQVDDWVFLKIRPISFSSKFFGLHRVLERIGVVAY